MKKQNKDSLPVLKRGVQLPALVEAAGPEFSRAFLEFFAATIRNRNTRLAYLNDVNSFLDWCGSKHISLSTVQPLAVAAYIEELGFSHSKSSVKQHLSALRMLFDYFVRSQLLQ